MVREGLMVTKSHFEYDEDRYGTTLEELGESCQHQAPVVVQRNRILRTRAMFDLPWKAIFEIDGEGELVDADKLQVWLDIAGRRIGLGDWRPEKSGMHGRFTAEVEVIDEND